MITQVTELVTAMKPTTDSRIENEQVLFQINAAYAAVFIEKNRQNFRDFGVIIKNYFDPSLFRVFDLKINDKGIARIPATILNLPFDYGIVSIFLIGDGNLQREVHVVNRHQRTARQRTFFGQRTPSAVRTGQELEFFNHGGLENAKITLITTDVPIENNVPLLDTDYPIAADLVEQVVGRAAQVLAGGLAQRPDYTTDGKDTQA